MNKVFLLLIMFSMAVISCRKEDCSECTGETFYQQPGWPEIKFKSGYTIQVPTGYSGDGMIGFEGNTFFKRKNDNTIVLQYGFCTPVHCSDFGNLLPGPFPPSVTMVISSSMISLDERAILCNGREEAAIFYYRNVDGDAYGKLYWKHEGKFMEALSVNYRASQHKEVMDIIKTIKRK